MADDGNGPAHTGLKLALALALCWPPVVGCGPRLTGLPRAAGAPAGRPAVPVPVTTARSRRQDVPLYLQRPRHGAGIQLGAGAQPGSMAR